MLEGKTSENGDSAARFSEEQQRLIKEIERLKQERGAVIMAHYYQRPEVQHVADFIGDSLALARQAARTDASVIIMCGVHFMGETAKLLNPDKTVIVPDTAAGCSLADSCPADEFAEFIKRHPGHTVVSYVNTSAAVKALTDIVVTSGNALKVINSLPKDTPIIFGPDRNLGEYINTLTGRRMVLWPGACHVHDRFKADYIMKQAASRPLAKILVHPECSAEVRALAHHTGSTAALLRFARVDTAKEYIVVTEPGILREMQRECPDKKFIPADVIVNGCTGCNECEYMRLITLDKVADSLRTLSPAIEIDPAIAEAAVKPIEKMLALS